MVELIWDGKYDKDGKRAAPLRVALPFQTVETVNESAQQRQRMLDLFSTGRDPEWRNRLIWGDKKYVLPSLLPEFAGKVDLIYIDPPFATGADFSFQAQVGDDTFEKEASIIEQKAYRDTWGKGLDGYLSWFYETVLMLHELLSDRGSIYIHLDYHVSHYTKPVLDDIFGSYSLRNEVIWQRTNAHASLDRFGPIHDTIFYYSKSNNLTYNDIRVEYSDTYVETFVDKVDDQGRRFMRVPLTAKGTRRGETGLPFKGIDVTSKGLHWKYKVSKLETLDAEGRIYWPEKEGGIPRLVVYEDELPGMPLQDIWTDIRAIHNMSSERLGYETQKPEALLERIIKASSNENDLVLDCFCGSGTTAAVAEKLGRRWITCDLGRFAIHTARKRLLGIQGVKPFVVQNLGKYERQVWQRAEFGENAEQVVRHYRRFILDLYGAQEIEGYTWLHGLKDGRMVHVGGVDSPIVAADVTNIAAELRRARGSGATALKADILGWDFALDMNETVKQQAQASGVDVSFKKIPREVLEKKAVEQGDIRFFELAALAVEVHGTGREVTVSLVDFIPPHEDVPEDVIKAVKRWDDWIDYWAIDFNYRDDTFHNEWQSYRTRRDRSLQLKVTHPYDQPGEYTIVVKVIDVLGNDTTKATTVKVGN